MPLNELFRTQFDFVSELARSEPFAEGRMEELSQLIVENATKILKVRRAGVWCFSDDFKILHSIALFDEGKFVNNITINSIDYPEYTAALRHKRSIIAHDVYQNTDVSELVEGYLSPFGITSMLDTGVRRGDVVIGVLCFEHIGKKRTWTRDEINFAGILGDLLTQAHFLCEVKEKESALKEKQKELEEANIALKNILSRFEEEKTMNKENIANNIEKNILPLIAEMKNVKSYNPELVEQLEIAVNNMSSNFYKKLAKFNMNLSPAEVKVCQMISAGYRGKEIADMLNISFTTVETHKKNIRKKLNLTGKSVNLKVFLSDLEI